MKLPGDFIPYGRTEGSSSWAKHVMSSLGKDNLVKFTLMGGLLPGLLGLMKLFGRDKDKNKEEENVRLEDLISSMAAGIMAGHPQKTPAECVRLALEIVQEVSQQQVAQLDKERHELLRKVEELRKTVEAMQEDVDSANGLASPPVSETVEGD